MLSVSCACFLPAHATYIGTLLCSVQTQVHDACDLIHKTEQENHIGVCDADQDRAQDGLQAAAALPRRAEDGVDQGGAHTPRGGVLELHRQQTASTGRGFGRIVKQVMRGGRSVMRGVCGSSCACSTAVPPGTSHCACGGFSAAQMLYCRGEAGQSLKTVRTAAALQIRVAIYGQHAGLAALNISVWWQGTGVVIGGNHGSDSDSPVLICSLRVRTKPGCFADGPTPCNNRTFIPCTSQPCTSLTCSSLATSFSVAPLLTCSPHAGVLACKLPLSGLECNLGAHGLDPHPHSLH